MEHDLALLLKPLYGRDRVLHLPGLGTFSEKHLPARRDTINGTLSPPETLIAFSPGGNGDSEPLLREVCKAFGMEETAALALISSFVRSVKDDLRANRSVEIPKMGRLYTDMNQQLVFAARHKIFDDSFGLPDVNVPPPPPPASPPPVFGRPREPLPKPSSSGTMRRFIGISLLLVVLASAGYFTYREGWHRETLNFLKGLVERIPSPSDESDAPVVTGDDNPNPVDFPEQENEGKLAQEPENEANTAAANEKDATLVTVPSEEVPIKTQREKKDEQSLPSPTQLLRIGVGVYGSAENAARRMEKVKQAGFTAHSEKVGQLIRVEVRANCRSEAEMEEVIRKVRATVEPTAIRLR